MKVLTVQQPFAWLIVSGRKQIETRSWQTWHRGPLLIHASGRVFPNFRRILEGVPLPDDRELITGAIVGRVRLRDVRRVEHVFDRIATLEAAIGDYSPGRFAWMMDHPTRFRVPIPARGRLGLWDHYTP